jgi:hypothetical protein
MIAPTRLLISAILLALGLAAAGCAEKRDEAPAQVASPAAAAPEEDRVALSEVPARAPPAPSEGRAGGGKGKKKALIRRLAKAQEKEAPADSPEEGEQGMQARSWFPETFLFAPLVVTDPGGAAEVSVRVPDRLTSWRVLALAHSRGGAQAGTVTSFLGTLPVYVDPVVPPVLRSGDQVRLPVNVVNTTSDPVTAGLKLSASGVQLRGAGLLRLTVPAGGSLVRYVTLRAGPPGEARLLARLGGADAVVKTLDVVPQGRPVSQTRSGTLAAPRKLRLERAAGASPTLGRVRLLVYPGALAILRSELTSSAGRSAGLADDAHALLLAGRAPALLQALGDKLDKGDRAALRDLTMLATQRALRRARVLDMAAATLLAGAAGAHPKNPVLSRLAERAKNQIVAKQAPDGSCGGASGWPLQRLVVATADCVRAAAGNRRVAIRASGFFERNAGRIQDPYSAAAVLASGAADEGLQAKLGKLVSGAIKARPDGSRVLEVPAGVVRADGQRPSAVEASALAVLALEKQAGAPLSDLGAAIIAGYSPSRGWGDGRASLVCMQAVLKLFRDPLPATIKVTLTRDGQVVAQRQLSRHRLREVLALEAAAGAGSQQWEVAASPAVPGLGFSLTLTDRVPWKQDRTGRGGGVELSVAPPRAPRVGARATVAVRATVPAGRSFSVSLALPAGVQADRVQLDKLVADGSLASYSATDAILRLDAPAQQPSRIFSVDVRVIPTLAGTLHSGASTLRVGSAEVSVPPARWTVR